MYFSDKDIINKLPELKIECENEKEIFKPEEQIQPSSIDLRLDNVFWKQKSQKTIDLRKSYLLELSPRRQWKKIVLSDGEYIILQPRELLLGRIYEKFTIPKDCAGKIEGRSSFSRMGLGIHICCDYINPGYRGHMPLQIVNYSKSTIRIIPYIDICQLMLVKLTSIPSKLYGEAELQSKYMDDDGGPSYWWRDKRLKELQTTFNSYSLPNKIQEQLFKKMGVQEPEIIERFEKFISKSKTDNLSDSEFILDSFSKREKLHKLIERIIVFGSTIFVSLLTPLTYINIINGIVNVGSIIAWSIHLIIILLAVYSLIYQKKDYLTPDKLENIKD